MPGNTGDQLIWLGTRKYLKNYTPVNELRGTGTLVIPGSGIPTHRWEFAMFWDKAEYDKIIVLPSQWEESERVRKFLDRPEVTAFARDPVSLIPGTTLAPDLATYAFKHRVIEGSGVLQTWRDKPGDISLEIPQLKDWLDVIKAHAEIWTDRLHVTVAALMMGKRVRYEGAKIHNYLPYNFPCQSLATPW